MGKFLLFTKERKNSDNSLSSITSRKQRLEFESDQLFRNERNLLCSSSGSTGSSMSMGGHSLDTITCIKSISSDSATFRISAIKVPGTAGISIIFSNGAAVVSPWSKRVNKLILFLIILVETYSMFSRELI